MTEQDVRRLIDEHSLTDHTAAILAQLRPAVYLTLGETGEGLSKSRIGGHPDLPADLEWPRDEDSALMTPLLQLNLRDIPAFAGSPFPAEGMLSAFVGLDESASDVSHHIVLFSNPDQLKRRDLPEERTVNYVFSEMTPHHLTLTLGLDLPRWETAQEQALTQGMESEQENAYSDLVRALEPEGTLGRLLGYASGIGQDTREDAYVVREADAA